MKLFQCHYLGKYFSGTHNTVISLCFPNGPNVLLRVHDYESEDIQSQRVTMAYLFVA